MSRLHCLCIIAAGIMYSKIRLFFIKSMGGCLCLIFKIINDKGKNMIKKWLRLKRKDIAPVQFIIEGYEGMATVTTMDPHVAIIQVSIIPAFLQEISNLLESLQEKYKLVEIDHYPEESFSQN